MNNDGLVFINFMLPEVRDTSMSPCSAAVARAVVVIPQSKAVFHALTTSMLGTISSIPWEEK